MANTSGVIQGPALDALNAQVAAALAAYNAGQTIEFVTGEGTSRKQIGRAAHPEREIIGIRDGVVRYLTSEGSSTVLTVTHPASASEWADRADSVRILLTNAGAGSVTIRAVSVLGKIVTRLSGHEGFIHDKFVDYELIAKNGEKVDEFGSTAICVKNQLDAVADYRWKWNRTKRHIYTLMLQGQWTWLEPGERYTLAIGGAGQAEYIAATVECYSVRCSLDANMQGSTTVSFREVVSAWKLDSNDRARFVASGGLNRKLNNMIATVAPSTYTGRADYYCDGAADEVEINAAIQAVYGQFGGGTVKLLRGLYTLSASIEGESDIILQGDGWRTVIDKNGAFSNIECIGLIGDRKSGFIVRDLKCTRDPADANANSTIRLNYADNIKVQGCYIDSPYFVGINYYYTTESIIDDCYINDPQETGIQIISDNNTIQNTIIANANGSRFATGITVSGNGVLISGNQILNCVTTIAAATLKLISVGGDNCMVVDNLIDTITASGNVYGIYTNSQMGIFSGNTIKNITTAAQPAAGLIGIYIFGANNKAIGNIVYSLTTTNAANLVDSQGIYIYADDGLISNNLVDTITTAGAGNGNGIEINAAGDRNEVIGNTVHNCQRGIIVAGANNQIFQNYCYGNGSDAGVANTNGHNFIDTGTDTQLG